jgi:hypothetical protein
VVRAANQVEAPWASASEIKAAACPAVPAPERRAQQGLPAGSAAVPAVAVVGAGVARAWAAAFSVAASLAAVLARAAASSVAASLAAVRARVAVSSAAASSVAVSSAAVLEEPEARVVPAETRRCVGLGALAVGALALVACKGQPHDLSTDELSRVVDAEQPALKRCYDAALASTPYRQEMRMEAVIEIAPSGRVLSVGLHGGGGLPGMADCIRNTIRQWQFPKAKDPTHTSLPIVFQPKVVSPGPSLETLEQAFRRVGPKPAPAAH